MRLSEFRGKELLKQHGLSVPDGLVANSVEEAWEAARKLGLKVIVKAMIPTGGRGKAGLVKIASDLEMARELAREILGKVHAGFTVDSLIIEKAIQVEHEYYLAIIHDDKMHGPVLIFSPNGGMDIEQIAENNPEKLVKFPVCPDDGFIPYTLADILIINFGLSKDLALKIEMFGRALARIYAKKNLILAEINPLIETQEGKLVAVDCKLEIDDAILSKYPKYYAEAESMLGDLEKKVRTAGGTLISLDGGNIGVICNGAGMGMAIIDGGVLHTSMKRQKVL